MDEKFNEIIERVYAIYMKYGIKSVTMDDVARELGMSKKTIYQYFSDKKDLVKKVVETSIGKGDEMMKFLGGENLNAIEKVLKMYSLISSQLKDFNHSFEYDLSKYYPDIYNYLKQTRREMIMRSFVKNIEKGKREGLYRDDIDAELIAKLHIIRVEGLMISDLFTRDDMDVNTFNQLFNYHIRGILSRKGLDFFEEKFNDLKTI